MNIIRLIKSNSIVSKIDKLLKLLDKFEIVEFENEITGIKIKGDLLIHQDGNTIMKSDSAMILDANKLYLNPDIDVQVENLTPDEIIKLANNKERQYRKEDIVNSLIRHNKLTPLKKYNTPSQI